MESKLVYFFANGLENENDLNADVSMVGMEKDDATDDAVLAGVASLDLAAGMVNAAYAASRAAINCFTSSPSF
jgi:hypothetical protein